MIFSFKYLSVDRFSNRGFFILMLACTFSIFSFGQENPSLTNKLKQKYNVVTYIQGNNGFSFYQIIKFKKGNHHDGYWGICNASGKEIIPPLYELITFYENFFVVKTKDNKHAVFDLKGKNKTGFIYDLIAPEYEMFPRQGKLLYFFSYIYGPDKNNEFYNAKCGIFNSEGKEVFPCELVWISSFGDQKTNTLVITSKTTQKNGLISYSTGEILIPIQYDELHSVKEDLCLCRLNDKYGFLNIHGEVVIPFEYDSATDFENGVAQVVKGGVASIISNPLTGTSLSIVEGQSKSKVDQSIPQTGDKNEDTFAFIIANENYTSFSGADYSINDGKIFKEYCTKTLGLPDNNVRYMEDATFGNIISLVQKIKDIADVYDGDAKIIMYYSGLGTSETATKEKFLLPVDATADISSTCYSLNKLMDVFGELNTKMTLVIVDAAFNGTDKNGNMLASHRGIAISSKSIVPRGKTLLLTACGEGETAYSRKDYSHGIFTYGLLDKLQSSKGNCSLEELTNHAVNFVRQTVLKDLDKKQTPEVNVSPTYSNWENGKLK